MDRVRTIRERKNLPDRNEATIRWFGKRTHGLWPLALSCTLIIVLGFCMRKSAQADIIPGIIPVIQGNIINGGFITGNINNIVIQTQFMNVTTRLNATRNSEEGRRMRGISGEIISGDLYAGLLCDAGFGYQSSADETSFFSDIGVFMQGADFFGDKELTRETAFGFDNKDAGLGVDYKLASNIVIGTLFNYTNADIDFDLLDESTDVSTNSLSVYGTYNVTNNIYVDGYGMYGWNDFDSKRNVSFTTMEIDQNNNVTYRQDNQMLRIDNTGIQYTMGITSGYELNFGAITVGPLGRLFYAKTEVEGFKKTINISDIDNETLNVAAQEAESLTTNLGMDASYAYKTPERLQKIRLGVLIPQVRAEWVHEYKNDSQNLEATLVQANQIMNASTADPDRDYFKVGCGLSAIFAGGISAYIQYEEILGLSHITAHNVAFGVRVEL